MYTSSNPLVAAFMAKAQANAQAKAKELAQLELDTWSEKTEADNKQYYGYTDKGLAKRKKELTKVANS